MRLTIATMTSTTETWGCTWISGAGIIAMMGTVFRRKAEGMKLHEVKASETRNRARAMARRMGIELRRIYVVPAGRRFPRCRVGGCDAAAGSSWNEPGGLADLHGLGASLGAKLVE